MKIEISAGATFSPCKNYRYKLWRIWDLSQPLGLFIGLNPSMANEKSDDPTIRRLSGPRGLAGKNGLGGIIMMNLYPFVTPYPEELQISRGQLRENDAIMKEINLLCESVIFCWGAFNTYGRDQEIIALFPAAYCFGKNRSGSPKHPLYLHGNTKLRAF